MRARTRRELVVNPPSSRRRENEAKQADTNRKTLTKLDCQHKRTKFRSDKRLPFYLFDRLHIDNLDIDLASPANNHVP